jgi:uncharacterized protein (DUF305 family)
LRQTSNIRRHWPRGKGQQPVFAAQIALCRAQGRNNGLLLDFRSRRYDFPSHAGTFDALRQTPANKELNMLKHLILAVLLSSPLPLFAQDDTSHEGHMMGDKGPASMAFMEANDKMHAAMMMEYSGNADVDFVKGMIAHHQGAVDMAKIVLEHGKDPEVKKLAETIVAAQEAEIKWMQDWLAKNGG